MVWIIGDIHGCLWELSELLRQIPANDPLVFLGDYVDRGPESRKVVDRLIKEADRSVFLKGNHEDMMLRYVQNPSPDSPWLLPANGGAATIRSYGHRQGLNWAWPSEHREFFSRLKLYYEGPDFLAVHAGFDVSLPLAEQKEQTLLWAREDWIDREAQWPSKFVYYGHTSTTYIRDSDWDVPIQGVKSLGIDTGCVFGGYLTAVHHETGSLRQVKSRFLSS